MKQFWQDERGQDLIEYALIVGAVGLALLTTVNALTSGIVSVYDAMTAKLTGIDWSESKH